jgi:hypothetical protein
MYKFFDLRIIYLEAASLGSSERELPRCPGKEGDTNKEGHDGVGSKTVTGAPEEVELEHKEHNDGDCNVETSAVTGTILNVGTTSGRVITIDINGSIELTLAVELVEPDDDKGSDTKEDKVEGILGGRVTRSHVGTVHTIHIENTHNGDYYIDKPVVIHKPWDSRGTDTNVLVGIMLGSSKDIEDHGKEDDTEDKVGPENAAAKLVLKERERSTLLNGFLFGRGISTAYGGSSRVCDHLDS